VIKALAGGGGRGMRIVHSADQIDDAYRQCAAEAQLGFGDPALFAEAHLADARHIEVQIVATPSRGLALGDRDCSIQRPPPEVGRNRTGTGYFASAAS